MLRVSLFGGFRVSRDGDFCDPLQIPRSSQLLLARLLLQPRGHPASRAGLADLIWGERPEGRARACLNTALWRLRWALEPEETARGAYLLFIASGEISFNWESDHWLDVSVFETAANRILALPEGALTPDAALECETALRVYTGDLLETFYEDWVLQERERLRVLYLDALGRLMRSYRRLGAYERGLSCGRAILKDDPLREDVHREMMRLYTADGQRAQAIRQYEACRDTLAAELGLQPMQQTQRLVMQIAETGACPPLAFSPLQPASLREAMLQLRQAMVNFEQARDTLQQAIQSVEYYDQGTN